MSQKRPNVLLLAKFRQFHSYFAMFAAPSILFFCLTGCLQLFSLHEDHGSYHPPALVEALGSLHKNQNFNVRKTGEASGRAPKANDQSSHDASGAHGIRQGPQPGADAQAAPGRPASKPDKTAHWTAGQILLKVIFAAASVAAVISTGLGIWVGLSFGPKRNILALLLAAGFVVPVLISLVQAL